MAKAMGKPRMFNPGVTIHAPPIPKKPPMTPTENPISTIPGQNIVTPAIGMYMYNQSMLITSVLVLLQLMFNDLSGCKVEAGTTHEEVGRQSQTATNNGRENHTPDSEHCGICVVDIKEEQRGSPRNHAVVRDYNQHVDLSTTRGHDPLRDQQANRGEKGQ
jgi:hypothetical protein